MISSIGTGASAAATAETTPPQPRLVRAAHEFEAQMMKELMNPLTSGTTLGGEDDDSSSGSGGALGEFAGETLDSEQKKLAAGVSNPTAVLQDQSALTSAESNLVSAMAAYEKARVELDRATGLLLDHTGVVLAEAQRGQVEHMPSAPDVAPRQDTPTTPPQPKQPSQSQTPPQSGH